MAVQVIDVDSHVYEPPAIWDEYVRPSAGVARGLLPRACRPGQPDHPQRAAGEGSSTVRGSSARPIWRPGMTPRRSASWTPTSPTPLNPGASDPAARLADMDAMGVDQPSCSRRCSASTSRWSRTPTPPPSWPGPTTTGSGTSPRPAPVGCTRWPCFPSRTERRRSPSFERCAERGFKSVLLRPMFIRNPDAIVGQSPDPADRCGQPQRRVHRPRDVPTRYGRGSRSSAWSPACTPSSASPTPRARAEGSFIERVSEKLGIGHTVAEPVAYMQDNALFVVIAMFHGLLEDFPRLKLALLHRVAR